MKSATPPAPKKGNKLNWIPWPDPIQEDEVHIDLGDAWTADERTRQAIERQAKLMGMSPDKYLHQVLAAAIAGPT